MELETRVLHGHKSNPLLGGVVTPPIQLSTTYLREPDGSYPDGYSYARRSNPNRDALEETLAGLEGGAEAVCFASGAAATMAVFQSLASGDHVLVAHDCYYGTREMLREIFPRWGLAVSFVDMTKPAAISEYLTPKTRLIWLETPSNPMMQVTDIARVVEVARKANALVVADNTVATPVLQRPIELGCDLVVHSTTKYINGHSDVLGGVVVGARSDETMQRIRAIQIHGGAVPSAFDCWLALRGVRTLPQRVREQSRNAMAVARFLAGHPAVAAVHYPGLDASPGHDIARRQMQLFGGLLSFEVRGGLEQAMMAVGAVKLISRATSLGGVESLIEHRASMEGKDTATPPGLLRLSVGLESAKDLIEDLSGALARVR